METNVTQDAAGTHLEWQHEGVTPKMIDWFWSNMEKGFLLWHPEQHEPLTWAIPPRHGNPIGTVHIAPQTWSDGTRQNLCIRFEDLGDVPAKVKAYVVYEHCIIVAGLGLGKECLKDPDPMGFRLHQWQKTDYGVEGKSSAIGAREKETPEEGLVWAEHCKEEIGNWGAFLADLYTLYKVVKNTAYNPFSDLSVEGHGKDLRYRSIHDFKRRLPPFTPFPFCKGGPGAVYKRPFRPPFLPHLLKHGDGLVHYGMSRRGTPAAEGPIHPAQNPVDMQVLP